MARAKTQGGKAVESGRALEQVVRLYFQLARVFTEKVEGRYLEGNVPYTNIYGGKSRSEFVYRNTRSGRTVRIECRYQGSSGSVDEKMPYLFMNAVFAMPEKEIWLVLGGDGARECATSWLKRQAEACKVKKIRVLHYSEVNEAIRQLAKEDK